MLQDLRWAAKMLSAPPPRSLGREKAKKGGRDNEKEGWFIFPHGAEMKTLKTFCGHTSQCLEKVCVRKDQCDIYTEPEVRGCVASSPASMLPKA